jgi:shikimate kinase
MLKSFYYITENHEGCAKSMFSKENSIVLIGFMGAGKTTIGQLLAQKLNRTFVDIDKEIEKAYQMPVTQIFQVLGEKTFRNKEKNLITQFCHEKSSIISVGGGAFLQKEIRDSCLTNCIVIYLEISWESWKERLSFLIDSRPILQGLTLDEIQDLFYKRQECYSEHHFKIKMDGLDIESIAEKIMKIINL